MLDVENELLTKRTLRFTHVTWPKHLYVNMFFILSCGQTWKNTHSPHSLRVQCRKMLSAARLLSAQANAAMLNKPLPCGQNW